MNKKAIYIAILVVAALITRFINISSPPEVVFDEVHFGKFVTSYCCSGERIFDIHPPHSKLLIAGAGRIVGYTGGFSFEHIGQPFENSAAWALRVWPAITGVMLPLVLFALVRLLGGSLEASFLAGLIGVFDNALIVQTRLIALDGTLLVTQFGAIAAYLRGEQLPGQARLTWFVVAGLLAGLAVGTKFTGLAGLAVVGLLVLFRLARSLWAKKGSQSGSAAEWFMAGVVILLAAIVIYLFGWWLHFQLLTEPGSGDVWGIPTGNFLQDLSDVHKDMLSSNYNLAATHPDASAWWTWPAMLTSVFYWSAASGATIYFLGNPVVWWGGSLLFAVAAISFLRHRYAKWMRNKHHAMEADEKRRTYGLWVLLLGFVISFIPLVNVPRVLFLYHYLTPLLFTILFGLLWLDSKVREERRMVTYGGLALLIVAGFIVFSPITYGFITSPGWNQALFWLPGWR